VVHIAPQVFGGGIESQFVARFLVEIGIEKLGVKERGSKGKTPTIREVYGSFWIDAKEFVKHFKPTTFSA